MNIAGFRRDQSTKLGFSMDECYHRGLRYRATKVAMALAAWPYQGFGNKFSAVASDLNSHNYKTVSEYTFDTSDVSFTYQKIVFRVDYDTGAWEQQTYQYFNYWVNGYGSSTLVVGTVTNSGTGSSDPLPIGNGGFTPGSWIYNDNGTSTRTVADFEVTGNGHLTLVTGPTGMPTTINYTTKADLSVERTYADTIAAADTALAMLDIPPYTPIDIAFPTTPTVRYDVVYPDAIGNLTLPNHDMSYLVLAFRGVLTTGTDSINGGTICLDWPPYNLPANAIICGKSKWSLEENGFSSSPYELYDHPLDETTFAPQAVVDLGITLSLENEYTFNPSNVPPYGFAGSYSLVTVYDSPEGYGELGLSGTITGA